MYLCISGIDFTSFYDISIRYWNCPDGVVFLFISLYLYRLLNMIGEKYRYRKRYFRHIRFAHSLFLVEFVPLNLWIYV